MILTVAQLEEMLNFDKNAGATSTDPMLKTAKVVLYVNNISPTPLTTFADLTECTITGYARSATITWANAIPSNETGLPAISGDAKTFTFTTQPDPQQTIFGYALVTTVTAVDHLLAIAPLPTPQTPANGTEMIVVPRVGLDDQAVNPSGDVTFL